MVVNYWRKLVLYYHSSFIPFLSFRSIIKSYTGYHREKSLIEAFTKKKLFPSVLISPRDQKSQLLISRCDHTNQSGPDLIEGCKREEKILIIAKR